MVVAQLLRKYKYDLGFIALVSAAVGTLAVMAHGSVKWYTSNVAMIAPLVFAGALLAALTLVGAASRARWLNGALRGLIGIAVMALVAPTVFLEVEKVVAPYEWWRGSSMKDVVQWIASDDNRLRIHAWARLLTMQKAEQDAVAVAMAPLVIGGDDRARHSAELSLEVPLRAHSLATLSALRGELRLYLAARTAGLRPAATVQRAGDFASNFVRHNIGAIHKALQKDKRAYLPPGGLEALFLALATEQDIGPLYLRELARHGDDVEKPLAASVLRLAAISAPTS